MAEETRRKGGKNPKHLAADTQPERDEASAADGRSRTAGTNRDFDEGGESKNEGHGHPREDRGEEAG